MAEGGMEEKRSIRDSARCLKKYGSTSNNHHKRPEHFIKHIVASTDTLQGLALKYGVTTEQIRRANRLWANDSIFLRESLLIPSRGDSLSSPSEVTLIETNEKQVSNNNNGIDSESSYSDFLVKIDCAIANTKSQVMLSQGNSEFVEEETLFVRRAAAMSRLRQQQQQQQQSTDWLSKGEGVLNSYQPYQLAVSSEVPAVMTQGRKVRTSLQRLQQQQDEMFQL